jgi:DNA-binding response OmpR family regulator
MAVRSNRVLVVDDHEDAGRLVGKLLRRSGYEVAELGDHQAAIAALVEEPEPIGAVVASFTTTGTAAAIRLLDAVRNHPDPKISGLRVLLVSEQPRQQIFCYQAGADAIVLRPFHASVLLAAMSEMLNRPEDERMSYRRQRVTELKADAVDFRGDPPTTWTTATAQFR